MTEPIGRTRHGHPTLKVYVQPRSAKNKCCGMHENGLKLTVTAPPVDGKANKAVRSFLAELVGVKRGSVILKSGETSRKKVFYFKTLTVQELADRLHVLMLQ